MDSGQDMEDSGGWPTDKFIENAESDEDRSSRIGNRSPHGKELVVPQERNWKGIFLSVLVITIVCIVVGFSAWLLQPPESSADFKYIYDFDAMFDIKWRPYITKGQWIKDSFVYRDRCLNIVQRTGRKVEILVGNDTMETFGIQQATLSPDLKYALLAYNVGQVFRHSTTAQYYIHNIEAGTNIDLHKGKLQYAAWGKTGSQLAYVMDFDLYYKSDALAPPKSVTTSGKGSGGTVRSGIADWVYEEEMFSSASTHWFSNSGSYLAYVTFNDSQVPQVNILIYNVPYPQVEKINYPKVGNANPAVELYIQDLSSKTKLKILSPKSLKTMETLLNSFAWTSDSTAIVTWSNRYQNISITTFCSVSDPFQTVELSCQEIHEQQTEGWIEYIGRPPVAGPGKAFFQIEEKTQGGKGKFHHLLFVDYSTNPSTSRFLTSGNWEVTEILGYNSDLDSVYYISTQRSPMDRHLYSVSLSELRPTPACHTCDSACKYSDVSISSSASFALLNCKGPGVPYSAMLDLTTNQDHVRFENNIELNEKVRNTKLPDIILETITIKGENGAYDFQAKLFLPPSAKFKKDLPLLVDIYAAPGSQKVDSRFFMDWMTFLVTNKDIAVLAFDGRGSGFRGSSAMKEVNRRLGKFEVEDQIAAIKQITDTHPYLSKKKIGVWGWSYGGYASAMLATHPDSLATNLTKCVISVAPVTDWRLYDSIYTERYMGAPEMNLNHYTESSLLTRGKSFANFDYLLVHGTRDDNVHFQNSAVLEIELVRAEVIHRYQVYTDETHSLSWTQRHFYKLMTQFLMECYQKT